MDISSFWSLPKEGTVWILRGARGGLRPCSRLAGHGPPGRQGSQTVAHIIFYFVYSILHYIIFYFVYSILHYIIFYPIVLHFMLSLYDLLFIVYYKWLSAGTQLQKHALYRRWNFRKFFHQPAVGVIPESPT